MKTLDRLRDMLPEPASKKISQWESGLYEVRLRAGRPVQLRSIGGEWLSQQPVEPAQLSRWLAALMDHSLYAREDELCRGFFTMEDGCRVGVCGRLVYDGSGIAGLAAAGSICIRISREVRGCADALISQLTQTSGPVRSTLILSPPGMGKTTLLREAARRLSEDGWNVCVADERHELAACRNGVPTLDVGPRTDVMDGCPKRLCIPHMLRACAPQVIVSDEIGDAEDALTLSEAVRCGVSVLCSAHGESFERLFARRAFREMAGIFSLGVRLGGEPGRIVEIRDLREDGHAFCAGALHRGGLHALRKCHGPDRPAEGGDPESIGMWHSRAPRSNDANAGADGSRPEGFGMSDPGARRPGDGSGRERG